MGKDKDPQWMLTTEVANLAGVSAESVREWERAGKLPATMKTPGGVRIWDRAAVLKFIAARERTAGK